MAPQGLELGALRGDVRGGEDMRRGWLVGGGERARVDSGDVSWYGAKSIVIF